jgi:hypothetical protein
MNFILNWFDFSDFYKGLKIENIINKKVILNIFRSINIISFKKIQKFETNFNLGCQSIEII